MRLRLERAIQAWWLGPPVKATGEGRAAGWFFAMDAIFLIEQESLILVSNFYFIFFPMKRVNFFL